MLPMLRPRPWMPLRRRRFEPDYTVVTRTTRSARGDTDGRPRPLAPTATPTRRRPLLRRRPSPRDLGHRIDELAAEAAAWVAELQKSGRGSESNP